MSYQEFDIPEGVAEKTYTAVEKARDTGEVRKGTNETTKAIERGSADLVVVAGDVDPAEIVMHIPAICAEKGIDYTYVPSQEELGMAAGIEVSTASVAITDPGNSEDDIKEIRNKIEELKEE
ncbi:MAG: 50S ribosomal protein L7Ae [Candidatus Nanohaloarchaeota archaeon QJJ-9]|nr:50S ribosomal protein L7Ae [Candidatus Nanohaloarchaeota archaeon QJJ-9]